MGGQDNRAVENLGWRQKELNLVTIPNDMTLSNFLKQSEPHLSRLLKEITIVSHKYLINTAITDKFFQANEHPTYFDQQEIL